MTPHHPPTSPRVPRPPARTAPPVACGFALSPLNFFTHTLLLLTLATPNARATPPTRIGSKAFTESVLLGETAAQLARDAGAPVDHRRQLGGTAVLWRFLLNGEIDAYPEYTGTITQEIFAGRSFASFDDLRDALHAQGIGITASLGFNDTYAIGVRGEIAERLNLRTVSDLATHPELRLAFSNEFLDRKDGWPLLKQRYALPQTRVPGLDHDLSYRALAAGTIDATDLYSTDAEIAYYKLRTLRDDRNVFPEYQAVFLYRLDLEQRAPRVVAALRSLENTIDEPRMIAMNARAKLDKVPESQVAADFLARTFNVKSAGNGGGEPTRARQILRWTGEHLLLVAISLSAAIVTALPLGVWAARSPAAGRVILAAVAAIYTVPSLALLAFMIWLLSKARLPSIGGPPAVVALFLYSLLPIVRNTQTGLTGIPQAMRESAQALGLPPAARLWRVELPLAMPSILAGIKTSAVLNVGTATLGALIGAGGYGQPILTGIRLDDKSLILAGAIPAAVMALAAQGLFDLLERWAVPRGLRQRGA